MKIFFLTLILSSLLGTAFFLGTLYNRPPESQPVPSPEIKTAIKEEVTIPEAVMSPNKIKESFKAVAESLSGKIKDPLNEKVVYPGQFSPTPNQDEFFEYSGEYDFDVEQTNSIVSPYVGRINYYAPRQGLAGAERRFELAMAFQEGGWVLKDVVVYEKNDYGNWIVWKIEEGHRKYFLNLFRKALNDPLGQS